MKTKAHNFVRLPLEPAAPWFGLGAIARAIGAEMFRISQDSVWDGVRIERVEDYVTRRLAPKRAESRLVRSAVRQIIEAGLIVECDGGVRLLYLRSTYEQRTMPLAAQNFVVLTQREALPTELRMEVAERDGWQCRLCGEQVADVDLHIDHVRPVAAGGTNARSNLQTAHAWCNLRKGARTV